MGENLPALIDRASQRLAEARNSAEVLEARAAAQAALHYAKITQAANDTQADCLRMIVRAEMRMADEVDRGQADGSLAHQNVSVRTPDAAKLEDIGISRQRLSEWRDVRDAGPEIVEHTIQSALLEGRAPTKTEILNAARGPFVTNNTGNNEWYTPPRFIEAAKEVMGGIDLDPASCEAANKIVGAKNYFSIEDDGLTKEWYGRVWLNPPYAAGLVDKFIRKFVDSNMEQGIVLVNNATETGWFQDIIQSSSAFCFVKGRISFINESGEDFGKPLQGQVIFYVGPDPKKFCRVFSDYGFSLLATEMTLL